MTNCSAKPRRAMRGSCSRARPRSAVDAAPFSPGPASSKIVATPSCSGHNVFGAHCRGDPTGTKAQQRRPGSVALRGLCSSARSIAPCVALHDCLFMQMRS